MVMRKNILIIFRNCSIISKNTYVIMGENGVRNGVKTIVVAGAHSGIGKTLVAEELVHKLANWSALKVTVQRKSSCPRKQSNLHLFRSRNKCNICTELKQDFEIIKAQKIINQKGTDTARLQKAGAKKTIWLRASLGGLKAGLKKAFYQLRDSEGIVIEGTSVLKYIKPSLAIYLKDNTANLRPAGRQAQRKADIIINVDR